MTHNQVIPPCESDFPSDVAIEFGRRFVPRHPWASFSAEVDRCEHEGVPLENLTFWARTHYETQAILELWEDRALRVSVILRATATNKEFRISLGRECDDFSPDTIAEAFRDTMSASNRLCYTESPLPSLRRIWRHEGEVRITGSLEPCRAPKS